MIRKLRRAVSFSDEEVRALEALPITMKSLRPGQAVLREAERPSQACLVLDGWLYAYKIVDGGRRQIVSFHMAGDFPDLLTLRLGVADFSLAALTPAMVALVSHESLRALTLKHPSIALALWHQTLIDAAAYREWMTGLGRRSSVERLAHLFCELRARQQALGLADKDSCPLPITQNDLADALGVTSVHINRSLKELRDLGLVTLSSRRLSAPNWDALASFADFDATYLHLDTTEPR